ncbi:acyltransferase [Photobacterium nomapromontoriensis]|uniref:acyltransferase n=1 Tax=Photobacterium nomapromontoriensis TaxID=2910237 RepID=UPI003D0F0C54
MTKLSVATAKRWIKTSEHPLALRVKRLYFEMRFFELPAPKLFVKPIYACYRAGHLLWCSLSRVVLCTPLFKSQLSTYKGQLYLYGGLPYCAGPLDIHVGNRVRMSGQTTFTGRVSSLDRPQLVIGNNVDVGWMTTIAVGRRVVIGDNVRIAGRTLLAGYPGHPLNAADRAAGFPETEQQVGDIILQRDVWLATGVTVTAGVCIGEGTIVAAGSVVTKDLPPYVLAAGVPARVVRPIER